MKKFIYIIFAAAVMAACIGCSKDSSAPAVEKGITGEWQLVRWIGHAPAGDFGVYLELNADGTFNMYQQLEEPVYRLYTGTFTAEDNVFSGTYSDGDKTETYSYSISSDGNSLTMTVVGSASADVSVYDRESIPPYVREEADLPLKSETGSVKKFL